MLAAQSNKLFNLLGFNPAHEKCQSISCSEEAILLLENSNGCAEIEDIQQKQDDQEESVEILENEDKVIEINGVSVSNDTFKSFNSATTARSYAFFHSLSLCWNVGAERRSVCGSALSSGSGI